MQLTRDLLLDEESRMLSRSVTGFREQVLTDKARDLDEEAASGVVEEVFKRSAALGLTGALLSEESGGQGMDSFSFCLALEEVAQGSAGLAAILLSHNLALWTLEKAGVQPGGRELLSGEEWAALAWPTEIDGGTAKAPFVPGGTGALMVVMVSPGCEVYTATREEGLVVVEIERPLGWRACRPATVTLDLSGASPAGSLQAEGHRELECRLLVGISTIALGISRHSLESAKAYATERWQSGDYIINHQQMELMLGGMVAGIETGEAAMKQLAWCADGGKSSPRAQRALKVLTCNHAMQSALDGVQIHGGYGYMRDYGMELLMRDAKACQVYPRSPHEETMALLE